MLNIYIHKGRGKGRSSYVTVVAKSEGEASKLVREILDEIDLKNEEVNISQPIKTTTSKAIDWDNGDY